MSPDGTRLYAVNTLDGYLEMFDLTGDRIAWLGSVPVGLEPVAVAARNDVEVWVVNHLSDSVSIVDVAATPPRVVRTLLLGDEPRDIVFAGAGGDRAFITTAHRGQNTPWPDGDYDVPGIGRADVWVYDATMLGGSLEGNPLTVITLFADRPRALAVSPDGSRVYAAAFRSGNRTVPVSEGLVCDGSSPCNVQGTNYPGGRPDPKSGYCSAGSTNAGEICTVDGDCSGGACVIRETGVIVGFDQGSSQWRDELGRNWNAAVPFSLPDLDVFEIDADASVPIELGSIAGVGTVLFNMIVNPANGDVYVTNTDANNRVRFEGFGDYVSVLGPKPSGDPASVRGNLHKARITVLDTSADNLLTPKTEFNVIPRHLNYHIPYSARPVPTGVKEKSLATPLGMAITSDGGTLYVAGFGSDAIARYNTAQIKNGTFVPDAANKLALTRPTGMVLDEARDRLYVGNKNRLYVVDTNTFKWIQAARLHSPEQTAIHSGRAFLYDANLTSSNGEASCSSCHVFGDMDDLSWDLGDPDAASFANPNPTPPSVDFSPINVLLPFDPQKGPMTTQSLRGMAKAGPMHWRGDRTGGAGGGDPLDEQAAFVSFNVAFPGLIGRDEGQLTAAQMNSFATFALAITYPPNPIRALNNSLNPQQQAGFNLYHGRTTDTVANCNGCHTLDRSQGFFGTAGGSTFENETMEFKVPHLRNAYQKIGMFGQMPSNFFPDATGVFTGDQVRGTGYLHDGSIARMADFLSAAVFDTSASEEANLEEYIMAFDSDLAPIVGQQATLTDTSGTDVDARIILLIQRANSVNYLGPDGVVVPECDLIVKGVVDGEARGWLNVGGNDFESDKAAEPIWTRTDLEAAAAFADQPLTFTCVPPGSGRRMGIDRDRDRSLDGDDFAPTAKPRACQVGPNTPAETASHGLLFVLLVMFARQFATGRRRRS